MPNDDPIAKAIRDYQRAPRELPTRRPMTFDEELGLVELAGQTVDVTHFVVDDQGVTRHTERATITHPILPKGTEQ
ncbi:hypothetical protein C731_0780 [Mycolicibacterium hassiacum DSM 44199]|uniref:Uncharacterized protein n=1 Tax=Mycolicibacterium hassiacum (strain DSM 44199 / CIP 105218 / JCM 12690 / 3849) TaxID=1122247 RepID=K5B9D4_MYCHD|nr:hypothetical protein [Mycolicibacterium hassiacum]EKF25253.1 hypothetical protein C731_0780 [Mycolicibacterium hassiacum DSM 44199]MDA4088015.1 hypothetical protein [Mycolicibacterium hassiacum DSM 44199]VCT89204.1 hypothetical protein MHAS_00891 [Mycolicibacterium hassiacum DSM 44199]